MPSEDFSADIAAVASIAVVPTLLDVVCRATGMGFAAITRVTEDRWIACSVKDDIAFGLVPGGELDVRTTLCREVRGTGEAVVIDHVATDPVYCSHPTPRLYGLQSYVSMPIVLPDGRFFGTLCAIDPRPAKVSSPEIVGMFKLFAELIAYHLDAIERLAASNALVEAERRNAELREQFIAVLGHDLRSPLAAIDAGTRMLMKNPPQEKVDTILGLMKATVGRMSGLIDNVLDLARGRLAGGIIVQRTVNTDLPAVLGQVVDELRAGHPDREIHAEFAIERPVSNDPARLAQLFANLLANALTHGDAGAPVRVRAATIADDFELAVINVGEPIPPAAMERLFQPFFRSEIRRNLQGLGLGLYIASEIAKAHGGVLDVVSDSERTEFRLRMPIEHPRQPAP
ncbi:GAF domain-containing sensor histidine kinase [Kaistia dalseonensis]|uniref:histidine kinase n=1 Tax=Kaistia dalseonensis TaxID=410840 RepID=A0ABU0H2C1_9HYPH|nr:GAF domain-containing sensor histidine kinase [Kaistia dalseonensis]MCX5493635.1 GAF domain-containing sensor histidine kinase [Kaistia dalseonensis]MDQ0436197.1 signal transduction histidine kinase [Kaistia dalseonensis]